MQTPCDAVSLIGLLNIIPDLCSWSEYC